MRTGRSRPALAALTAALVAALLCACSDDSPSLSEPPLSEPETTAAPLAGSGPEPKRADPRLGGLEVGLGEWALTPEADAIRPGRVSFILRNRGTIDHGFEIELEGDSRGHGSGDLFKAETGLIAPGDSARLRVELRPGIYKIECLVEGHDDMGMEGLLEVRRDAPLVKTDTFARAGRIAIIDFAFSPKVSRVEAGTEIRWHNEDPASHTVTATGGDFDSGAFDEGGSFSFEFEQPGRYEYRCAIHPEMEGTVEVE